MTKRIREPYHKIKRSLCSRCRRTRKELDKDNRCPICAAKEVQRKADNVEYVKQLRISMGLT